MTILDRLPHRGPAVLLDEIVELTSDRATALKTFRPDDRVFDGHFPCRPIVPGVLLIDALAQLSGLICFRGIAFLAAVTSLRFCRPVAPDELIVLSSTTEYQTSTAAQFRVRAHVDGELALSGTLALGGAPEVRR